MFKEKLFIARLKELRNEAGYTQKDIAQILEIGGPSYQRYENGSREPNLSSLCLLADTYSVTTDYLLGRSDTRIETISKTKDSKPNISFNDQDWVKLGKLLSNEDKKRIFEILTGHDFLPYNEVENEINY